MSLVTFNTVRFYTQDDVYHYTADNRPLQDLASNDTLLQAAIDILAAAITSGGVSSQDFAAGVDFVAGTDNDVTLISAPPNASSVWVFFDGVYQNVNTFTVSGTLITFGSVIPLGVTSIEVKWSNASSTNTFSSTAVVSVGDANITLGIARDIVVTYTAPLTANRTVSLPTGGTQGFTVRVTRTAAATGAFTVTVGAGLKLLNTAGTWADFIYTGTAWVQTAAGSL